MLAVQIEPIGEINFYSQRKNYDHVKNVFLYSSPIVPSYMLLYRFAQICRDIWMKSISNRTDKWRILKLKFAYTLLKSALLYESSFASENISHADFLIKLTYKHCITIHIIFLNDIYIFPMNIHYSTVKWIQTYIIPIERNSDNNDHYIEFMQMWKTM